ncbi:MAG TPA: Crp/Fnr family transcriptional regulator [Thermoanaerobaculia bacterium]|nr:Crp/Fnr family transcriptional regulator [Thermoanaerobaculia bacterium]
MTNVAEHASAREDNAMLAALPVRERNAAHKASKLFVLDFGATILHANTRSHFAFFPIRGAISLVRHMRAGPTVEVGVVGNEGMVGIDIFLEAPFQANDAIVQGAGSAWRMPADHLLARSRSNREMQRQLLRFTDAFLTQISQTAACNRVHDMEARLARWLLMMQDRVAAPQLRLTQQFLAQMLGARTATVNEAVQKLEAAGVIGHRRQEIAILDREGLERTACECYGIVRRVFEQSLTN